MRTVVLILVAIIVILLLFILGLAMADIPPTVVTVGSNPDVMGATADLNGRLDGLGTIVTNSPPTFVHGPSVQTTPGFDTITTIDTTGSNLLLIIFGRGKNCGSLTSVTTTPSQTVLTAPNTAVSVNNPSTADVFDARYVLNPTQQAGYQVDVAWTSSSCDYGTKYLVLYTFTGSDLSVPAPDGTDVKTNFDWSTQKTISFGAPSPSQTAVFSIAYHDTDQAFKGVGLTGESGLTNTVPSSGNCVWCIEDGIGYALTATGSPTNHTDYAARGILLNGTVTNTPRSSVDVFFQWGPSVALGTETTHVAKTTTGAFTASLSGLFSGRTYYFRACTSSSNGVVCGATLSFQAGTGFAAINVVYFVVIMSGILSISVWVKLRRDGSLR